MLIFFIQQIGMSARIKTAGTLCPPLYYYAKSKKNSLKLK